MRMPGLLACMAAACLVLGCRLVAPGLSLSGVELDARARGARMMIVTNDFSRWPVVATTLVLRSRDIDPAHANLAYVIISDRCYQVTANFDMLRHSIDPSQAQLALTATNNPWMLANLACVIVDLYDPCMRAVFPAEAFGDDAAQIWPYGDPSVRTDARGTSLECYSVRYDGSVDRVVVLFDKRYRIAHIEISRADETPNYDRAPVY